jgi:hypothetical protein
MLGLRLYDVVFWTEQLVLEEEGGVGGCASSPRLKLRNELEHNHFMVVSSARLLDEEEKRREEKRRDETRRGGIRRDVHRLDLLIMLVHINDRWRSSRWSSGFDFELIYTAKPCGVVY